MENFTVHTPEQRAAEKVPGVQVCGSEFVNLLLDARLNNKPRAQSVNEIDRQFVLAETFRPTIKTFIVAED